MRRDLLATQAALTGLAGLLLTSSVSTFFAVFVLACAPLGASAQPPDPVGDMTDDPNPEVAPLAQVFAGNDGGAYYVRERGDQVYWFAEHPGLDYAHVFRGTRSGDEIKGRYWSVPKGSSNSTGQLTLKVRPSGTMRVVEAEGDFPTQRFSVKTIGEIEDVLPRQAWPKFNARGSDFDGGFVDEQGRRYYVRTVGRDVVFFVESRFEAGELPRAAYVFVGRTLASGSRLVSGDLIAVPKGRRRKSGTFSFAVRQDKAISGDSDITFFQDVFLRPLASTKTLDLLGRGGPIEAITTFNRGFELFEGDIVVNEDSDFRSLVVANKGRFWPNCEVPYELAMGSGISREEKEEIEKAIQSFNTRTNIKWQARSAEDPYYVVFRAVENLCENEQGMEITCANSSLGRQLIPGLPQFINFSKGRGISAGTLRHEMGHAIGLRHEQNRFDRDEFVEIVENAIIPGQEHNFKKETRGRALDIGPYDYASMMHYDADAFSRDGRRTVVPKVPGVTIGRRDFSDGDLEAMEHLCPAVVQVPGVSRRDHGAGIAVGHLGGNARRPEIVLAVNDDAIGPDVLKFRIGRDASATGVATWSDAVLTAPGMGHRGDGMGIALGDLTNDSIPELIAFVYDGGDPRNTIKCSVWPNLGLDGSDLAWGPVRQIANGVSLGNAGEGLGIDLADINRDGQQDLIVAVYDAPDGPNEIKYMVGFNFKLDCSARWEGPFSAGSLGHRGDGMGVAVGDVDSNGVPDILFGVLDDSPGEDVFKVKFLLNVTPTGTTNETRTERFHGHSHSSDGAGIAIFDFDNDGEDDLVVMSDDDPGNDPARDNQWKYRVIRGGASQ